MNEAQYLELLDSTLDIYEWEDEDPISADSGRLTEEKFNKLLGEANLDVTHQGWIGELVKIHGTGCGEYLIATLFVLPFHWMSYHEILCDLLGKSDERWGLKVVGAATSFWAEWWKSNQTNRTYSTLVWRDKSPRLTQALNAFTLLDEGEDFFTSINSQDAVVRLAAARNPHISSLAKKELAKDEEADVRLALAISHEASPEILEILADDPNSIVRRWVAANPNTYEQTLTKLSLDPNPKVRDFLKQNPKWNRS